MGSQKLIQLTSRAAIRRSRPQQLQLQPTIVFKPMGQKRSLSAVSDGKKRKVVRDPRKGSKGTKAQMLVRMEEEENNRRLQEIRNGDEKRLPFSPSYENEQSVGSSLGSYALAGAGMALGFTLVRVVFGV